MTRTVVLLVSACLLVPLASGADDLPGRMVMVGDWHGDEVSARDGETWVALEPAADDRWRLQERVLRVEAVVDDIVDTPPARTGKRVATADDANPLVLLRNLPQLKPGPVAVARQLRTDVTAQTPAELDFEGGRYRVGFRCPEALAGERFIDCGLVLEGNGQAQVLARYKLYRAAEGDATTVGDAVPNLLWAGDLDGDGRLDLLIDLTDHYNVRAPTLLLSGAAKDDPMVRAVAVFRTTGC